MGDTNTARALFEILCTDKSFKNSYLGKALRKKFNEESPEYKIALRNAGQAAAFVFYNRDKEVKSINLEKMGGIVENIKIDKCAIDYKYQVEDRIITLLAGVISMGYDELPANWEETEIADDIKLAMDLFSEISKKKGSRTFDEFWECALYIIIEDPFCQQQIKAIADALMERKTLSGEQVKKIIS